jgi:two-component system cell cycle response regulator
MSGPNKEKILVVDDEAVVRDFLQGVLTAEGYSVITAEDGEQAVFAAVKEKPDLILLDILMPKLDGMQTCARLRANPYTRDIRVIILTAYNSLERMETSIERGADDFLGKPINVVELCVRVRAMLEVKDISDEVERMEQYVRSMKALRDQASAPQPPAA